jgi:predicted phosphodiesterase
MLLGLIADVHEADWLLREALDEFRRLGVDEIVFLGDLCGMHERLEETAALMREAGVVGVWGNHDFGLCHGVDEETRKRYSPELFAYTEALQGSLVREDCLFTHVEPWLDPHDLMSLWYFDGLPDTPEKLKRCFDAAPQRVLISGHVHRWFLASQEGPMEWAGGSRVGLRPPGRYLLIVDALVHGWAATYDTATGELTPLRLKGELPRRPPTV